jgi:TldD protein
MFKLDDDLAILARDTCVQRGASYAEGRLHSVRAIKCILRDGKPEPSIYESSLGIGIRALVDGCLAFSSVNLLTKEGVRDASERAVKIARVSSNLLKKKIEVSEQKAHNVKWEVEEKKKVEDVSVEDMVSFLKEVDNLILEDKNEPKFANRVLNLSVSIEEKVYANSDGSFIKSKVSRVGFSSMLSGVYEGKPFTVSAPPGYAEISGSGGWELIDELKILDYIKRKIPELKIALRAEEKIGESEKFDVIIGPSVAGLASHEASGHPQEADRILGREAAQAGESYLKKDDLGIRIGSDEACVSDDPTITGSFGFYLYDDEGVKARKKRLIDKGIVSEFLQNRETSYLLNAEDNASARACAYNREPIIRMSNTFIEAGNWSLDEMVKDTKSGLLIESYMEWNIDDRRLNQRYVGLEAFRIENGEIKNPVKQPVLEITTHKLWSSMDARSKELRFFGGTCGKGDPMQGIPVWMGAPYVRLRGVRIWSR